MHVIVAGNENFVFDNIGFLLNVCDNGRKTINNVITESNKYMYVSLDLLGSLHQGITDPV